MSALRDGGNSPERRLNGTKSQADLHKTIRGGQMAPPPPKMKDLFVPPTPTPTYEKENSLDLQRSGSVVRHVDPEDPYDDSRSYRSYQPQQHTSMAPPPRPAYPRSDASYSTTASYSTNASRPMSRSEYPVAPPSRHTSNTSSVMTGSVNGSGSENWETYTDTSDADEGDATDAYYAKVRAQQARQQQAQGCKRPLTAHGVPAGKRQAVIAEEREGSEAGWTDEGDIGDTY